VDAQSFFFFFFFADYTCSSKQGVMLKSDFFVGDDRKLKRGNLLVRILFSRAAIEMEEEGLLCLSPGTLLLHLLCRWQQRDWVLQPKKRRKRVLWIGFLFRPLLWKRGVVQGDPEAVPTGLFLLLLLRCTPVWGHHRFSRLPGNRGDAGPLNCTDDLLMLCRN